MRECEGLGLVMVGDTARFMLGTMSTSLACAAPGDSGPLPPFPRAPIAMVGVVGAAVAVGAVYDGTLASEPACSSFSNRSTVISTCDSGVLQTSKNDE